MMNEDHRNPDTRKLIRCFMRGLDEIGYSTYAAEAFQARDHEALQTQPPSRDMGYYVTYEGFPELIEEARGHGWTLLGYEVSKEDYPPDQLLIEQSIKPNAYTRREFSAAARLAEFADKNPEKLIFVHVGHAHLLKGSGRDSDQNYQWDRVWLANILQSNFGYEVLSIDQTNPENVRDRIHRCAKKTANWRGSFLQISKYEPEEAEFCAVYADYLIDRLDEDYECPELATN